jgi:hypothetical protein
MTFVFRSGAIELLENGYIVFPEDDLGNKYFQRMKSLNLIEAKEGTLVYCVNPADLDYSPLSTERRQCNARLVVDREFRERGFKQCPDCGRTIYLEDKKVLETIWRIKLKPLGVKGLVDRFLSDHVEIINSSDQLLSWRVGNNGLNGMVTVLDYMPIESAYQYMNEDTNGFLGIVVGNQVFRRLQSLNKAWNLVPLESLIETPELVAELLQGMLVKATSKMNIEESRAKLRIHLANLEKGRPFEEFCRALEIEIFSDQSRIRNLLLSLKANQTLMFRPILLSGSARPDIVRLPLYNYLSDYFTSASSIDSKHYEKTNLTITRFSKAWLHARRLGQDSVVLYVASDNVATTVWEDVFRVRGEDRSFKSFIIDESMMSFLIASLGIEGIFI